MSTADARTRARRDLRWMALFLLQLIVPFVAASWPLGIPLAGRVLLVGMAFALVDSPLVRAGATGRGPEGIVQPWRWPAYAFWLGVRCVLATIAVLVTA